jgi:hypothetical protein
VTSRMETNETNGDETNGEETNGETNGDSLDSHTRSPSSGTPTSSFYADIPTSPAKSASPLPFPLRGDKRGQPG